MNVIHNINRKGINTIISQNTEKASDRNQNAFMLKTLSKLGTELQLIHEKPILIIHSVERLNTFSLKSEARILFLTTLIQHFAKSPSQCNS